MTNEELIEIARKHLQEWDRVSPDLKEKCYTSDELPNVSIEDVLMVTFSTVENQRGARIYLNKKTGERTEFVRSPRRLQKEPGG